MKRTFLNIFFTFPCGLLTMNQASPIILQLVWWSPVRIWRPWEYCQMLLILSLRLHICISLALSRITLFQYGPCSVAAVLVDIKVLTVLKLEFVGRKPYASVLELAVLYPFMFRSTFCFRWGFSLKTFLIFSLICFRPSKFLGLLSAAGFRY